MARSGSRTRLSPGSPALAERRVLHPTLSPAERRRLFLEGIERFNRGEHFESHESWEEIWRSTAPEPRDLFQGLVQIAAGMHHFLDLDHPASAARVLGKGRRRLETFLPGTHGLDLEKLVLAVRAWEEWLKQREGEAPPVPRIEVVDAAAVV